MREFCLMMLAILAATWLGADAALGADTSIPPGCAQIVAVLEEGGGGLSAEEVAKKTSTDVETVRNCTNLWRSTMKDGAAPKGVRATNQPVADGCAKIVAVLEEGGGGLSPEEVAKKTSTDIETVRSCTDAWRKAMEGGPDQ